MWRTGLMIFVFFFKLQGDILRAEGKEEQEGINSEKTRLRLAAEKRHRDAFVDTVKGDILLGKISERVSCEEYKFFVYFC